MYPATARHRLTTCLLGYLRLSVKVRTKAINFIDREKTTTAVVGVPEETEELRAEVERLLRETAKGLEETKERLRRSREEGA